MGILGNQMVDKCKTYPMPPTDLSCQSGKVCFPVTSLLSLSDLLFHNLLLITQCDGHPMLSNEPSLKLIDSCYFSPFIVIYLISKNSPVVSPWGDAEGCCLWSLISCTPSCVMCCWGWLGALQLRCSLLLSHWMPPSHFFLSPSMLSCLGHQVKQWTAATVGRIGETLDLFK